MPVIRTGRKPVSVVQTPATGLFSAAPGRFAATGSVFVASNFGPAIGAAAVRAAAGINSGPSVTVFSGTPGVAFRQMVPGDSTANMQTDLDSALVSSTHKVWWPPGEYRVTTALTLNVAGVEHRFATGPLRTSADTAIVKGSELVTTWSSDGLSPPKWFKTGQTQNFDSSENAGLIALSTDNPPAATVLEAYFKNGIYLHPAAAKATVANNPNLYWFDNANDTVWVGFNANLSTIERTRTQYFIFEVKAQNITMRGGITEHAGYENIRLNGINTANPSTNPDNPSGFSLIDHESRYGRDKCLGAFGHAQGGTYPAFRLTGITLTRCYFHHGARHNFTMTWTTGAVAQQIESAYGNFLHYGHRQVAPDSEGGDKTLFMDNYTQTGMWTHDNDGSGTWQDTGVNGFIFEESVSENNYGSGIHYEDNSGAIMRYNYLSNNNRNVSQPSPYDGSVSGMPTLAANSGAGFRDSAFFISSSANVELHHNWVNLDGRAAIHMRHDDGRTYRVEGAWIHDNLFYHSSSANSTWDNLITYKDSDPFVYLATSNNRFNFNTYHVRTGGRTNNGTAAWFFAPSGTNRTFAQWQAGLVTANATYAPASFHDPNSTLVADI